MEKKNLAKMALTALLLSSSAPSAIQAVDMPGTFIAAKCGGEGGRRACGACGGGSCGAPVAPGSTTSTTSTTTTTPNGYPKPMQGNPANPNDPRNASYEVQIENPRTGTMSEYRGNYNSTPSRSSSWNSSYRSNPSDNSGMSSYQGTTTGPGPNGGYPGAPRGSYDTYYNTGANPSNR